MSFLKHLGTTASKFEFHFWMDHVVGVYPSDYSTVKHSTEGIYCILKRNNKSYRTKIALPENGGYVHVNDCIKFTSTLYQKKKRHENISSMLPKPFILRVCDAKRATIRWQTTLDLSEYASVFGVDAQESFTLQFAFKSSRNKSQPNALQNIPFEITVRLRVKSTWLNNVDNLSQTSTGSTVSRISSSVLSDLSSDIETLRLYQDREPNPRPPRQFLFKPLPEDHSVHNSPIKPLQIILNDDHPNRPRSVSDGEGRSISNTVHRDLAQNTLTEHTPTNESDLGRARLGRFESVLETFKVQRPSVRSDIDSIGSIGTESDVLSDPRRSMNRNLSLCSLQESAQSMASALPLSIEKLSERPPAASTGSSPGSSSSDRSSRRSPFNSFRPQSSGNLNLSMLMSPDGHKPATRSLLKSPPIQMAFARFDTESSGILMEEELQRIDRRMSSLRDLSLSPDTLRQDTLHSIASSDPSTNSKPNSVANHEVDDSNGQRDGDAESEKVDYPKLIQLVLDHSIEGVHALPIEQRIYDHLIPMHCAVVFRCFVEWDVFNENEHRTALMLQRYVDYVTVAVQDEERMHNDLESSYWMIRMTVIIYWVQLLFPRKFVAKKDRKPSDRVEEEDDAKSANSRSGSNSRSASNGGVKLDKDSTEEMEDELDTISLEEDDLNLQCWFVQKLTDLAAFCFDNIMANLIEKLSRIPFSLIFDESEFGEQGSSTMDMIFAAMNWIWILWNDLRLFDVYRLQICHQVLQYTLVQLVNQLLIYPEYCTVAGGFRVKVIKSMVADWCQSNQIDQDLRFKMIVTSLEEVSNLLLTCAVVENGKELLALCPTLSAAQINQILNNYNSEATNEPLSAEILTPIMEIAAWEDPSRTKRLSIQDVGFSQQHMMALDVKECPLPKIILNDIPVPPEIAQIPQLSFLSDSDRTKSVVI